MAIFLRGFFSLCFTIFLVGCATPLISAIKSGDTKAVKDLLEQGANVAEEGDCGYYVLQPPLVCAAYQGRTEAAKILLNRGGDVNAPDGYGNTALMFAAGDGNLDLMQLLLAKGANMDVVSPFGWTALGYASPRFPKVVNLLAERGANIDAAIAGLELRRTKFSDEDAPAKIQFLQAKKQEIALSRTPPSPSLPQPVIQSRPSKELPKAAVWNLEERNIPVNYAKELTSILVSEIDKLKKYKVYSQENVRTLAGWTAERMQLGCTDTKCLTALGQMDVTKLISGSVGKIGSRYSVSLNLFDTQKTEVEKAVSEFGQSEDELIELVQRGARKLLAQ